MRSKYSLWTWVSLRKIINFFRFYEIINFLGFIKLDLVFPWVRLVRLSVCGVGLGVPLLFGRGAPLPSLPASGLGAFLL